MQVWFTPPPPLQAPNSPPGFITAVIVAPQQYLLDLPPFPLLSSRAMQASFTLPPLQPQNSPPGLGLSSALRNSSVHDVGGAASVSAAAVFLEEEEGR